MTDMTDDKVKALLDGATPGRRVQFHGSYCPEAVGTPFTDWDTSHDMSVIRPDGSRYRLAHYKHASDAYLSQMAPDLARALLDARAELARVKADAQAAVAMVVERCAEEADRRYAAGDMGNPGHHIRALAPADGLALLQELRAERDGSRKANQEMVLQVLAALGQAQEAYEAQSKAEAERDRLALANAELKPLLQNIGDGIANMFDQLVKGNWRDDHDHDVKMNVHMLNLQDVLKQIIRFRADYLDYSEPNFDKHKATSTEREGK